MSNGRGREAAMIGLVVLLVVGSVILGLWEGGNFGQFFEDFG